MAVLGTVDLRQSRIPGLTADDVLPLAVLAEAPSVAQITGKDPTPPPLVLVVSPRDNHAPN